MSGALAIAVVITTGIFLGLTLWPKPPLTVEERLRLALLIAGGIGLVLGGVYAYRKQVLAEHDSKRIDRARLDELFSTALQQLGDESPAIRLGGVYSMARLADTHTEAGTLDQRQACIDVLCAMIRLPWPSEWDSAAEGHIGEAGVLPQDMAELQVRSTVVRTISQHLHARSDPPGRSLLNLGRIRGSEHETFSAPGPWSDAEFDFTGAHFMDDMASFNDATFSGELTLFRRARFSGQAYFADTNFSSRTDFYEATFCGPASFDRARFSRFANFRRVTFSGFACFPQATFSGWETSFIAATFLHVTSFEGATFSGPVAFRDATFVDETTFKDAIFSELDLSESKVTSLGTVIPLHPLPDGSRPLLRQSFRKTVHQRPASRLHPTTCQAHSMAVDCNAGSLAA